MTTRPITLTVDGMTCGSCVRHVTAALRTVEGVTAVEVERRAGRAVVTHDAERASTAAMIAALAAAGYEARVAA